MFIQQRQHQETRESPHCCWWKQERVGDCGAGRRRGEWRQGEREGERNSFSDSNLGTWYLFMIFLLLGKHTDFWVQHLRPNQSHLLPSKGVCVCVCIYPASFHKQYVQKVNQSPNKSNHKLHYIVHSFVFFKRE